MQINKSLVLVAALVGSFALPAVSLAAPPRPGGYMSIFVGASTPQDSDVTISEFNPVSVRQTQVQYDPGLNIGGTAGYDFGYVRLEGELSYKRGEFNSVTDPSSGTRYVNMDGHIGATAVMVNTFFDLHNESPITPYLGGGLGFATLNLSDAKGVDASTGALNYHVLQSDDDNVFAYQVGGGIEVGLTRCLSLDLGYRYFATSNASFHKDWPNTTDLKLQSHNAAVALRVKF
jgi:opacity protein-like surface antigen